MLAEGRGEADPEPTPSPDGLPRKFPHLARSPSAAPLPGSVPSSMPVGSPGSAAAVMLGKSHGRDRREVTWPLPARTVRRWRPEDSVGPQTVRSLS